MVERWGEPELSRVFSLNNHYGHPVVAASFETPLVEVVPTMAEFDLEGPDPSGFRHLTTHQSFKGIIGSGRNNVSMALGPLDFGAFDISRGSGISCVRCFVFRVAEFDCLSTRVYNMKVWAPDVSDFLVPESFRIIYTTKRLWPSGFEFPVDKLVEPGLYLPTSLPERQNLRRQDGGITIHGSGDADVSEYALLAVAASGTLPLGEYLGDPEGFVIRVTYHIDNIDRFFD